MSIIHLTEAAFAEETAQGTVLLDFWATWCGPCRMLAPVLEEVAAQCPDVKVCKIDVDAEMNLAMQFGISSIPTVVVLKDGKPTAKSVGYVPKSKLLSML